MRVTTTEDHATCAGLLKALPFAPLTSPEKLPAESITQYLARVFDLAADHLAHAEGQKVDAAARTLDVLASDGREGAEPEAPRDPPGTHP
jgi:hypothetical protein